MGFEVVWCDAAGEGHGCHWIYAVEVQHHLSRSKSYKKTSWDAPLTGALHPEYVERHCIVSTALSVGMRVLPLM